MPRPAAKSPAPAATYLPIRVFVAGFQELDRKGVAALLRADPDIDVVGDCRSIDELARACLRLELDVVVVDPRLPTADGASPIRSVLEACPGVRVVALVRGNSQICCVATAGGPDDDVPTRLSCHTPPPDCLGLAFLQGAFHVLLGTESAESLTRAVRATHRGHRSFRRRTLLRMVECVTGTDPTRDLTIRERQVALLVGAGRSNKGIAAGLGISLPTAKKHVGHVLHKLGLSNRLQMGIFVTSHPDLIESDGHRPMQPHV